MSGALVDRGQIGLLHPTKDFFHRHNRGLAGRLEYQSSRHGRTPKERNFEVHSDTPFREFQIIEFAKREYGLLQNEFKGLHGSLFVPYCNFKELLCPLCQEENGLYSGGHPVLSPLYALGEHLVRHFGTRKTPSRYQRTIWWLLIPGQIVLFEWENLLCSMQGNNKESLLENNLNSEFKALLVPYTHRAKCSLRQRAHLRTLARGTVWTFIYKA